VTGAVATGVVRQPDGKLVVAAISQPGAPPQGARVYRFDAAGAPDPTFGTAGVVQFDAALTPLGVGIQSNGKLVVGSNLRNAKSLSVGYELDRLNADGSVDTTFGSGGKVQVRLVDDATADNGFRVSSYDFAAKPDDKLVFLSGEPLPGSEQLSVRQFTAKGQLD